MDEVKDELKKITDHLEYLFIKKIIEGLKDESISIPSAKNYAIVFRNLEPFNSVEDAKKKMNKFADQIPIFNQLKDYTNAYHTEQKLGAVIEKMRDFMQNNQIDEALEVATSHH